MDNIRNEPGVFRYDLETQGRMKAYGKGLNEFPGGILDVIARGPWVDVRTYSSFSAAIDAIGALEKALLIPNEQVVTDDKTVPSNVTLTFLQGGSLNISNTKTVTINGYVDAGLYQIFKGTGVVSFPWNAGRTPAVHPEWWGAKADNSTDSTAAIAAAIASLPSVNVDPKIIFQYGRYVISGAEAVVFNKAMTVEGNGCIFNYGTGTGTAIRIGGDVGSTVDSAIIRDFIVLGNGAGAVGVLIQNLVRSKTYNLESRLDIAFKFYADGSGCSYNHHYGMIARLIAGVDIGMYFECSANAGSYVTGQSFHGGSVIGGDGTAGSRGIEITSGGAAIINGMNFFGTLIEPTAERKVKDAGHYNSYNHCYWNAALGGIDIEFTATSGRCMIIAGGNLRAQGISDAGTDNMSLDPHDGLSYGSAKSLSYLVVKSYWSKKVALPDEAFTSIPQGNGMAFVSADDESGMWVINGTTVTKVVGTANTATSNSNGNLCVFYSDPYIYVYNRLGAAANVCIYYHYY